MIKLVRIVGIPNIMKLEQELKMAMDTTWSLFQVLHHEKCNVVCIKLSDIGHTIHAKILKGGNADYTWWVVKILSTRQAYEWSISYPTGRPVVHFYVKYELWEKLVDHVEALDVKETKPFTIPDASYSVEHESVQEEVNADRRVRAFDSAGDSNFLLD